MKETDSIDFIEGDKETKNSDINSFLYLISNLKTGTLINNRYKIEKKIGEGGVGVVYKAYDTMLEQTVALKFINPLITSNKRKFHRIQREVTIARDITDPRLVKVFSLETWQDIYFNVMEFVEGESLKDYLRKKKKLSWKEFKPIFFQILDGVKTLHNNNIIHRDLKPSNILITKKGKVKIVDFGLSKDLEDETKTSSIGEITGTPHYIPPEQVIGEPLGFYSDLYQLGVILFQVITGKLPYDNYTSTVELLYKKVSEPSVNKCIILNEIPEFLSFAIKKAMEIEPKNRFKTVDEFKEFLSREKVTFIDKFLCKFKKLRKKVIFKFILIGFLLLFIYFFAINNKTISKIKYNKSKLIASNFVGVKLFEKEFSPYYVYKAILLKPTENFLNIKAGSINKKEKIVVVFLNYKGRRQYFPMNESISSRKVSAKIVVLNKKGRVLSSINNYLRNYSFGFAQKYYFIRFKKLKYRKRNYYAIFLRHFIGMYPTRFFLFSDNMKPLEFENPGIFEDVRFSQDGKLLILARQNIFSHTSYFIPYKIEKKYNRHLPFLTFPQLSNTKDTVFKGYIYHLPGHVIKMKEIGPNKYSFEDSHNGNDILLEIGGKYSLLTVIRGNKRFVYRDSKENLKRIFFIMDKFYYEMLVAGDYENAYKNIKEALRIKINNPYLKSAILYLKGVVELNLGKIKDAEKTFKNSLSVYSENSDSVQKICEIEFLRGNFKKALYLSEIVYKNAGDFWGLTHEIGTSLFSFFINLQTGNFLKAREIINDLRAAKCHKDIMKGILLLFEGSYKNSINLLLPCLENNHSSFRLGEYRLFLSRTILLNHILYPEDDNKDKELIKLAKFYLEDIYKHSPYDKDFAKISHSYFLFENGNSKIAISFAKNSFNKLLKESKVDFGKRLWLFYDSFIYGKLMEKAGNIKEAVRGYKTCIKANPYSSLAREAQQRIKELKKNF